MQSTIELLKGSPLVQNSTFHPKTLKAHTTKLTFSPNGQPKLTSRFHLQTEAMLIYAV